MSNSVNASLLISPTKVTFEHRERSKKLVLINSGKVTRTYRLSWKQMQALPQGGYKTLDENQTADFSTANQMIRFSPKQVTLKAGERQVIKMALRTPKGLEDGEYRSHLLLTALPPKDKALDQDTTMAIKFKLLMNYTLPVMVRKGEYIPPKLSIESPLLTFKQPQTNAYIKLAINRKGAFSSNGNIIAYFTEQESKEEQIVARINDYNIYHELNQVTPTLTWSDFPQKSGKLRIVYQGKDYKNGKIFAEKTIMIDQHSFTPSQ